MEIASAQIVIRLLVGLCFAFAIAATNTVFAQARPRLGVTEGPPELADFFHSWNEAQLTLSKAEFNDTFLGSLNELAEGKPAEWKTARVELWERLPAELKSELPISPPGQIFLLSLYSENTEEFYRRDTKDRTALVRSKLYLILTEAQRTSKERGLKEIPPSALFVAMEQAWTGLWPFCPRTDRPRE
jgi:hypothetical protein